MLMRRRRRRLREELRPHNDRRRHLIPNGYGVAFAYDPSGDRCGIFERDSRNPGRRSQSRPLLHKKEPLLSLDRRGELTRWVSE